MLHRPKRKMRQTQFSFRTSRKAPTHWGFATERNYGDILNVQRCIIYSLNYLDEMEEGNG